VHHQRHPGRAGRRRDRGQHPAFERADPPVADPGLEHPGPDRLARRSGGRRPALRPVLLRQTVVDVRGEAADQAVLVGVEQPVPAGVVLLAVRPADVHHREPGGRADPGHRRRVPAEPGRGRLDHRVGAGGTQRGRLDPAAPLVVQLVAGQQRRDLEQVLVVVAAAEPGGVDVAEDRADPPAHSFSNQGSRRR
jgi:hypothetical protein